MGKTSNKRQLQRSDLSYHDQCVENTNSESLLSKLSVSNQGYRFDSFLHVFRTDDKGVVRQSPRSAAINRGYLSRLIALENTLEKFLLVYGRGQQQAAAGAGGGIHQVLSLGAGYDTMYFRLRNQGVIDPRSCRYFEVDFPVVARTKSHFIRRENGSRLGSFFSQCTSHGEQQDGDVNCSFVYDDRALVLIGCSMVQVATLEEMLEECGFDWRLPTFVLTECSLTYVEVSEATRLTQWLARKLEHMVLVDYEQINPNDAFGKIMTSHFRKRNSPLKCVDTFPTIDHHTKRFESLGWTTKIHTISEIMRHFHGESERHQAATKCNDQFDEFEELQLKCSHYILVLASNSPVMMKTLSSHFDNLCCDERLPRRHYNKVKSTEAVAGPSHAICARFGHQVATFDGNVYLFGGYSQTSYRDSVVAKLSGDCGSVIESDQLPGSQTLHCAVTEPLSNGDVYLFGGRASPNQPCDQLIRISSRQQLEMEQVSSSSESGARLAPRWRHTFTRVDDNRLVLVGGRSNDGVLKCVWMLDPAAAVKWRKVLDLPYGVHSHSACVLKGKLVLTGGLDQQDRISDQIFIIDLDRETVSSVAWPSTVLIPRFAHTSHAHPTGQGIVLIGGVSSAVTQPEIGYLKMQLEASLVENVEAATGYETFLHMESEVAEMASKTTASPLLLVQHSSLVDEKSGEVVIVGGGGNCFSFGMHVNKTVVRFSPDQLVSNCQDGS